MEDHYKAAKSNDVDLNTMEEAEASSTSVFPGREEMDEAPSSLMEELLKISDGAEGCGGEVGDDNNNQAAGALGASSSRRPPEAHRQRSLMETLLMAKMERASASVLRRMDSTDSATSSVSSSTTGAGSDVCRCDDCLLGIADLYATTPAEEARRRTKVRTSIHPDDLITKRN